MVTSLLLLVLISMQLLVGTFIWIGVGIFSKLPTPFMLFFIWLECWPSPVCRENCLQSCNREIRPPTPGFANRETLGQFTARGWFQSFCLHFTMLIISSCRAVDPVDLRIGWNQGLSRRFKSWRLASRGDQRKCLRIWAICQPHVVGSLFVWWWQKYFNYLS